MFFLRNWTDGALAQGRSEKAWNIHNSPDQHHPNWCSRSGRRHCDPGNISLHDLPSLGHLLNRRGNLILLQHLLAGVEYPTGIAL